MYTLIEGFIKFASEREFLAAQKALKNYPLSFDKEEGMIRIPKAEYKNLIGEIQPLLKGREYEIISVLDEGAIIQGEVYNTQWKKTYQFFPNLREWAKKNGVTVKDPKEIIQQFFELCLDEA